MRSRRQHLEVSFKGEAMVDLEGYYSCILGQCCDNNLLPPQLTQNFVNQYL